VPLLSNEHAAGRLKDKGAWRELALLVLPLLALGGLLAYMLSSGPQQAAPVATSAGKSIYLTTAPDNWASIGGTLNNYVDRRCLQSRW
jgi:hypothetical protein